jgi:serine/threonine protein kinase/Tfp pilus assembly protein PilF
MTPERWQKIRDVLEKALELGTGERSAFLDGACSSDPCLRQEVETLLSSSHDVRSSFLQSPPLSDGLGADPDWIDAAGALQAGQVFEQRFQLVRKLGEGGMGQIWLADQTSPVRRQIALKLIRAGMYDEAVVQRFQAERQALAIMEHPTIAKVFDAGTTPQGQPYFVMEYVPGLPITEHCDQKKLKIRNRLELFLQACEGVQHAHQKAIIHRDLKPANILVLEVDGKPVPRIIDFGLAKGTMPPVAGESPFTHPGHFMGTPGYMSPEQADPSVQDLDTRTDVYSLGVVLYVLLAGSGPFDTKKEQKQWLDELLRKLREEEPPRPSTKVSADPDTAAAIAEARRTEPKQLVSLLRGDLDWITMKALEKNRARRYGAPSELAADIRRYLNHEPVVARPASAGYRLRRYVRRHRITVGVAAGLVLLLATFSVLQTLELRRITRERDRANRITDFMTDMFKVSDPREGRGNNVTVREILDKASNDIGKGLAKDPEVQSQMMHIMASTYLNLGLYARAHELAKRVLDVRLSLFGPDDRKTLESMTQVGWILAAEEHNAEAEKVTRQALATQRTVLGPEDPLTLETAHHLAVMICWGEHSRVEEAEKLDRDLIAVLSRKLGPEHPQTLRSMGALAEALRLESRFAEAEKQFRHVLEVERRVSGPEHPATLDTMHNLAILLLEQGRYDEAEALYREALAMELRVLGPDTPYTADTMSCLADAITLKGPPGRLTEAEDLYRKSLEIEQRVVGPEHPFTTFAEEGLAKVLSLRGHYIQAEKLQREALGARLRLYGPDDNDTLVAQSNLADVLFYEGHFPEADKLIRETMKSQARVLGAEHPNTLASKALLARILTKEGHAREAEVLARQAFEAQLRILGPQHADTLDTLQYLGTALSYNGRYTEATGLFRDVIEKGSNSEGQGNPWSAWYAFACVAAAANHLDDALGYLQKAINRGYKGADHLMADDDLRNLRHNPHFQEPRIAPR